MLKRRYIGDIVRTRFGVVRVVDRRSWSDQISSMDEVEAGIFSRDVQARYGADFRELYQLLHVELEDPHGGSRYMWIEAKEVEGEVEVVETKGAGSEVSGANAD